MVKVDPSKCVGCGLCAGLAPETFQMNLDGKSEVINSQVTAGAKQAAAGCPTEAITVTE
jgi:ferredoxin